MKRSYKRMAMILRNKYLINMKGLLCLFVLLSFDGGEASGDYRLESGRGYEVREDGHHYVRFDQPDQYYQHHHDHQRRPLDHHRRPLVHHDHHRDDHIERPCHIHDTNCIRQFLAHESGCTPAYGPAGVYIIKKESMNSPHANVTFTINNAKFIGLDTGKIKEFYINKKTDTLVLEVVFEKLIIASPRTVVTYHRKGKEPLEVADFTVIEFSQHSLTMTVKNMHDHNLAETHVYAYLTHPVQRIEAGPGLIHGKDQSKMDMKWLHGIDMTAREAMVKQAPVYLAAFMKSNLCDFRRGH